MEKFENLTIKQLKRLTESYKKLQDENFLLKRKYPNKVSKDFPTAEELVRGLK